MHLLVNYPPKVAVSKLVNSLKGVSSRRLRQEFPDLVRHYWRAQRLWSGSYFAGSVGGAPLSIVRQYIEQQNRPVQGTARPLAGLPARAFTTAVNGGALARNPVALVPARAEVDEMARPVRALRWSRRHRMPPQRQRLLQVTLAVEVDTVLHQHTELREQHGLRRAARAQRSDRVPVAPLGPAGRRRPPGAQVDLVVARGATARADRAHDGVARGARRAGQHRGSLVEVVVAATPAAALEEDPAQLEQPPRPRQPQPSRRARRGRDAAPPQVDRTVEVAGIAPVREPRGQAAGGQRVLAGVVPGVTVLGGLGQQGIDGRPAARSICIAYHRRVACASARRSSDRARAMAVSPSRSYACSMAHSSRSGTPLEPHTGTSPFPEATTNTSDHVVGTAAALPPVVPGG